MFIFALGLTMWAYNVSSDCESFWKMLVISLSRESQQCQYAHYGAPIGVIFMLLGGLVGVGGASMKDEDRMNWCNLALIKCGLLILVIPKGLEQKIKDNF
jgi:hypothetical protein